MVAQLVDGRFVALHLDAHTRTHDVWVSAGTLWPVPARWTAIRHCVQDVDSELDALAPHARHVHEFVQRLERSTTRHPPLLERAEHVANTLERVEGNVARLLDSPTSDDRVELCFDYETVAPEEPAPLAAKWPAAGGLDTDIEMLAYRALCVRRLVDIRGRRRSANESRRMRTQAREIVEMIERVRMRLATLRKHADRAASTSAVWTRR